MTSPNASSPVERVPHRSRSSRHGWPGSTPLRRRSSCLVAALHSLLFTMTGEDGTPAIVVEGHDVAEDSDGLHGELFGEDGWLARFSKYGAPPVA